MYALSDPYYVGIEKYMLIMSIDCGRSSLRLVIIRSLCNSSMSGMSRQMATGNGGDHMVLRQV